MLSKVLFHIHIIIIISISSIINYSVYLIDEVLSETERGGIRLFVLYEFDRIVL